MKIPVALQLYTLREVMKSDFMGILEKVAEIGYQGVEFAGFGGIEAGFLKRHLDSLNIKVAGSHTPLTLLRNDIEQVIEDNLRLENQYIIVPYADFNAKNDYLDLAEELSEIGTRLKERGLQLCYHNHSHELKKYDDKYGLDILFENTESGVLKPEIDTYWVKKAGIDPISYLKKYNGRTPLVHIKDMEEGTGDFAEVGEGIIDIRGLVEQAKRNGAEWLVVEQDQCKRPALESIEISFNNLKDIEDNLSS